MDEQELDKIGDNIAFFLYKNNLKQKDLADLSGVSQSQISRIQNSQSVSRRTLFKIAEAIGIDLSDLVGTRLEDAVPKRPHRYFASDIFTKFAGSPILMLLAQSAHSLSNLTDAVLAEAKDRWGKSNSLDATPYSYDTNMERYFARLGRQCGFEDIKDAADWDDAFDTRLQSGEEIFLLLRGLDRGSDEARQELAKVLRSLIERHGPRLQIVLAGGEKLAALKYEEGVHSILNIAEVYNLPELKVDDVLAWQQYGSLEKDQVSMLLEVCGGHPRLLRFLLQRWLEQGEMNRGSCVQALEGYSYVREEAFLPFSRSSASDIQQLCKLLVRDDLGEFYTWNPDKLIRRLYWADLLRVTSGNRLEWRCDVLRNAGLSTLKCDKAYTHAEVNQDRGVPGQVSSSDPATE